MKNVGGICDVGGNIGTNGADDGAETDDNWALEAGILAGKTLDPDTALDDNGSAAPKGDDVMDGALIAYDGTLAGDGRLRPVTPNVSDELKNGA